MIIRDYIPEDERGWVACRLLAFLDSSYCTDVRREKEHYTHPAIELVAVEGGQVVGLLDLELDAEDLCRNGEKRGAMLWHLGVLPEYRRLGAAQKLWEAARKKLLEAGVRHCELWTQEDVPANGFYRKMGFSLVESRCYLRCSLNGDGCREVLQPQKIKRIYGAENILLDVSREERAKWEPLSRSITEVRLYCISL